MKQLEETQDERQWRIQRRISAVVTIFLVLAVLLCLYVAIQVLSNGYVNFGGYMVFRVVTGSMEPTIHTGALLLTREVPIESIGLNDIVCFRTQEAAIWGKVVTHRVVEVLEMGGRVLLRTQGDANLVADGYLVDSTNFIGKVTWYTGDDSILAGIFSFFTNKVGFLGCIVFPCLLLAGMLLKNCVGSIRQELQKAMYELENPTEEENNWELDPLCGMTQEEYQEMYERIRAELMEELMQCADFSEKT